MGAEKRHQNSHVDLPGYLSACNINKQLQELNAEQELDPTFEILAETTDYQTITLG